MGGFSGQRTGVHHTEFCRFYKDTLFAPMGGKTNSGLLQDQA
tara:strand:- start:23614 stop:23739 length:126 start_codon:yes stop_codon:yes gene_type:complete